MTAVDHCAPAPAASPSTQGSEFTCAACAESFATPLDHRTHFKSERHVYNTKRKSAGLKAISQEAWERKLRESRAAGQEQKGTAHLKANKPSRKGSGYESQPQSVGGSVDAVAEEAPLTSSCCLFDRKRFSSIELCLAYMEKTYSFFIPDVEYCNSVDNLLSYLGQKVSEGHTCINCNRRFPDMLSTRRHMIDKGHTQLASEVHTRRGGISEEGTAEMQLELEQFYDFHKSLKEVSDKIKDPKQKIASILRYFDIDKDTKLGKAEVANLWAAAKEGAKLSEAQYEGACAMCEADPKDGLDVEALGKLYASGMADLDEHFAMLQDLLMQKKEKPLKAVAEGDEDAEDDDDEDDESGSDDDEILEFDDEDEFAEAMRVLGLERVSLTDTGDLRLPNGNVAVNRDVSHIYKQRGTRMDQVALVGADGGPRRLQKRAQLMLSAHGEGSLKIAMTQRQQARVGKQIIAVLRTRQHENLRTGMTMNTCNRTATKIRTGRGDCSNGR